MHGSNEPLTENAVASHSLDEQLMYISVWKFKMARLITLIMCSSLCLGSVVFAQPPSSLETSVPHSPAVYRSGGKMALRYEIHLKNPNAGNIKLVAVDILDGKRGTVIESYGETKLASLVQAFDQNRAARSKQPFDIVSGEQVVIYIDLIIPRHQLPKTLSHKLTFNISGGATAEVIKMEPVVVGQQQPLVLGPPLKGGPWVAVHHAGWQRGHRRMIYTEGGKSRLPGRFAIDWVGVSQNGKVTSGNRDNPKDALGYGAEVIAVADATVFSVRDGMAETGSIDANGRHSAKDAAGNHIVLDLGQGRYAFYEHLKPGSIVVRSGQRVRRGDVIGSLGFTGDSTGPHLHFHVADGPTTLGAEGLPFVIDKFHQRGRYLDLSLLGKDVWAAGDDWVEHERPSENVVIEFDSNATPSAPVLPSPPATITAPAPPILEGTIAEMTWPELEKAANEGAVVLWAIGAIEEHGRHLPLATDVYVPQTLVREIQRSLTKTGIKSVILPPNYWGVNAVTDAFPGSLKISPETMSALLNDVASSIGDAGFSNIFMITGHYDAAHNRAIVAGAKAANAAQKARVTFVAPRSLAARLAITPEKDGIVIADLPAPSSDTPIDLHAGEDETSKMLAIDSRLVAHDVMQRAVPTQLTPSDLAQWRRGGAGARQITPDGHLGAPAKATAAKGQNKLEAEATAYTAAILSSLSARPRGRNDAATAPSGEVDRK
ncbi:MAG: creatininase family protein [Usitatibacteraceae bacterium]